MCAKELTMNAVFLGSVPLVWWAAAYDHHHHHHHRPPPAPAQGDSLRKLESTPGCEPAHSLRGSGHITPLSQAHPWKGVDFYSQVLRISKHWQEKAHEIWAISSASPWWPVLLPWV